MRVLLVEDDNQLSVLLADSLHKNGFAVTSITNPGALAAELEEASKYAVVVLDRLLGAFDTKEFLPAMKARWPHTPVVILSAVSTPSERTDLLNLGADDYLGKPFSTQELLARIRVVQRRAGSAAGPLLVLGNTTLDSISRIAKAGRAAVTLPAKEFLLMKVLCDSPGQVWSRTELLEKVWEMRPDSETNVVEATVTNLRRRLSGIGSNLQIRNMRNSGYWIED